LKWLELTVHAEKGALEAMRALMEGVSARSVVEVR